MAFDTFLDRSGSSLAKFVGTVLREIEGGQFKRRMEFAVFFVKWLKKLRELEVAPEDADRYVEMMLKFTDRPQIVTGGEFEVGGAIENARETEFGIDLGINFSIGDLGIAGGVAQGGADFGISYRSLDREMTRQNFRCVLRWAYIAGPVQITQADLSAAAQRILENATIPLPEFDEGDLRDPSALLTKLLPILLPAVSGGDE